MAVALFAACMHNTTLAFLLISATARSYTYHDLQVQAMHVQYGHVILVIHLRGSTEPLKPPWLQACHTYASAKVVSMQREFSNINILRSEKHIHFN